MHRGTRCPAPAATQCRPPVDANMAPEDMAGALQDLKEKVAVLSEKVGGAGKGKGKGDGTAAPPPPAPAADANGTGDANATANATDAANASNATEAPASAEKR